MLDPTIVGLIVIVVNIVITYLIGQIFNKAIDNPDGDNLISGFVVEGILFIIMITILGILQIANIIGTVIIGRG